MKFLKWLKYYREKSGLSMNKLSDLLQVKLNTIWRWENGKASPSVEMATALANILHVSETELLNGPVSDEWNLKIKLSKEGVIDVSGLKPSAEINIADKGIAVTLSGSYEMWADDAKFENFVEQLRTKRQAALKFYQEAF